FAASFSTNDPSTRTSTALSGRSISLWCHVSRLLQCEIARSNVRMEAVLPRGVFFIKTAKEAVLGYTKCGGVQVASIYRGIGMPVVGRITDLDGEISGVNFNILVPSHTSHREITGGRADEQVRTLGNLDPEPYIVTWAAVNLEIPRTS